MRTPDQSKRNVRIVAIGGTALATVGIGVAFAANPHPATTQPVDQRLVKLQQRERTLASEATTVNAEHDAVWARYRAALKNRQDEIRQVNDWNAKVRAQAQANAAAAAASSSSSSGSSSSGASPSAGYVPSPPVASSGSS